MHKLCIDHENDQKRTYHFVKKEECAICLDDILPNNLACAPCGHQFCFTCILRSFYDSNACPYCRAELVELPDDDYSSDYSSLNEHDRVRRRILRNEHEDDEDEDGWETISESEESDNDEPNEMQNTEENYQKEIDQLEKEDPIDIEHVNLLKELMDIQRRKKQRKIECELFALEDKNALIY
jgi:hypothetical protein